MPDNSLAKIIEYLKEQNKRWRGDSPSPERQFGSLQEEYEFLRAENQQLWEERQARNRRQAERAEIDDLPPGCIRDASGVHPPGWLGL